MSNQDFWYQSTRASSDQDVSMKSPAPATNQQPGDNEPKLIPTSSTNQQKRQNSNSLGMSGAIKRSVTQPNSPSFLLSGHVTPNQQQHPVESSRATAGTLTPALTSNHHHLQNNQHSASNLNYQGQQNYSQQQQAQAQVHQEQQQQGQPLNFTSQPQQYHPLGPPPPLHQQYQQPQQQQMAPFKATFNIPSPTAQVPAKNKKFSTTFVNNTYQKSRTPDLPNSPNLSVNKAKFETSSYINDDHTDVNDFNETNSVVLSQTATKQAPSAIAAASYTQPTDAQRTTPQPQISQLNQQHFQQQSQPVHQPLPSLQQQQQQQQQARAILTKEVNPDSPGSTISESSTTAQSTSHTTLGSVGTAPTQTSKLSEEEQVLILKLQDTYKTIIRLEGDLQRKCQSLNLPQRLDMTELWDIYNTNITLLNSYYDFLLYSLSSGKSGKQIIQVYRVPRRLWVYGIVTFLDVLKNVVSIFIEHDICSSFIGYSFNILSGLTELEMDGWVSEKLGDLSRMAIALYPSRYIDWKLSSEYWYTCALKTQYGFGKIYYHIATVQQDNLDALVNIGKSVFCRDTFVPTPQYMRMVIDNINQRNFVDLPVVDFIKVHKILLSSEFNSDLELIKLVSYYSQNIGVDHNKVNFFVRDQNSGVNEAVTSTTYNLDNDYENKLNFWFQRSSSFALVNICQIVGFGNSANPFAHLFGLVEALKERKDRKDKKDKRKKSTTSTNPRDNLSAMETENEDSIASAQLSVDDWFQTSDYINKNAIELAMRMFKDYLDGPIITSTPHVITYLYFIIAVGEALKANPAAKTFFQIVFHSILPRESLLNYLNDLLKYVRHKKPSVFEKLNKLKPQIDSYGGIINYFNQNENLIEAWKCWGTLWFDKIQIKEDFSGYREAGIEKENILDVPIGGARYEKELNDDRFLRVLLLASYIADEYDFGLRRGDLYFKFNPYTYDQSIVENQMINGSFQSFLNDTRIQSLTLKLSQENILETEPSNEDIYAWLQKNDDLNLGSIEDNSGVSYTAEADNEADYEADEEEREQALNNNLPGNDTKFEGNIGVGMDSSLSYFILDTNMWLKHCGMIYKSVRSGVFKLSVPLVVFQELRSLRRSPDGNASDAAVRAVITLRQLATEGFVSALRLNGTEATSLNDVRDFENNSTWMNTIDDSIINSARSLDVNLKAFINNPEKLSSIISTTFSEHDKQLLQARSMHCSILITDDRNMRLKARTKLVPAFQGKWFFQTLDKLTDGKCSN